MSASGVGLGEPGVAASAAGAAVAGEDKKSLLKSGDISVEIPDDDIEDESLATLRGIKKFKCIISDIQVRALYKDADPFIKFCLGGEIIKSEPWKKSEQRAAAAAPSGIMGKVTGLVDKAKDKANAKMTKLKENIPKIKIPGAGGGADGTGVEAETVRKPKKPISFKTDVIKGLGKRASAKFRKSFEKIWKGKYEDLEKEDLVVQLWDSNCMCSDDSMGEGKINLLKLANGSVEQKLEIIFRDQKSKVVAAEISFRCYFQEIYTFTLRFDDWNGKTLRGGDATGTLNGPQIRFAIDGDWKKVFAKGGYFGRNCVSNTLPKTATPLWEKAGVLHYRGIRSDLENEEILVSVYDYTLGIPSLIGSALCPLRGVVDYGYFKTGLIYRPSEKALFVDAGIVEGYVNVDDLPAHMQFGDPIRLRPDRQYLAVHIRSANTVPARDINGYSDPFVVVEWESMKQETKVIDRELNPVWDQRLYFPLRVPNVTKEEVSKLPDIRINLFDYDESGNDFLGGITFPVSRVTRGDLKAQPERQEGQTRSYAHEFNLEYLGSKSITTLQICAYFTPDLPKDIVFDDPPRPREEKDMPQAYLDRESVWRQQLVGMGRPGSYSCKSPDECLRWRFIPTFLCPTRPPKELWNPLRIARMINCFTFQSDTETFRDADDVWSSPNFFLDVKKGDAEEHALLMCNLFLGIGKDAYICIGRTKGGEEHVWVMTREDDGSVIYWETTSGKHVILPGRWAGRISEEVTADGEEESKKSKKDKKKKKQAEQAAADALAKQFEGDNWFFYDEPIPMTEEEILGLNLKGQTSIVSAESGATFGGIGGNPADEDEMDEESNALPRCPRLAYSTLEVVANHQNLWANIKSPNPARLSFDLPEPKGDHSRWLPFIGAREEGLLQATPFYDPRRLAPKYTPTRLAMMRDIVYKELKAGYLVWRFKQNMETKFLAELSPILDEGLRIMERNRVTAAEDIQKIKANFAKVSKELRDYQLLPAEEQKEARKRELFNAMQAAKEEVRKYDLDYWKGLLQNKCPAGYDFTGAPVSFSYGDHIRIRQFVMEKFDFHAETNEEVQFAFGAAVIPYHNGVVAVWAYAVKLVPNEEAMKAILAEREKQEKLNRKKRREANEM